MFLFDRFPQTSYRAASLLLAFVLATFCSAPLSFSQTGTTHALLIGIDEYEAQQISDLAGCANDVELMRRVLIGKFDVASANITVLKNEQATRRGIIDAIRSALISKARPGDVVILHFSGHGSQMKDQPGGDEIDGFDETLVPHDSRTDQVFDISDDEMNGLLKELTDKTDNVTFILDSCHSGSAIRGGSTIRMIEADERPPPPPVDFAISARGAGDGQADFRPSGSGYVLISGCRATELSNEALFDENRHGVMTWFLTRALQTAGDTSTYRSVLDDVKTEVANRYPSQHPQLEGPGADLRVFHAQRINSRPYVLVEPIDSQRVSVDGGKAYGFRSDSVLKVYAPATGDFEAANPVATIKVTDVEDFSAEAVLLEGGPIAPHSMALVEAINFGSASIPVHFRTGGSASLGAIKQALAPFTAITATERESDARLIVSADANTITIESGDLEILVPPVPLSDPDHVKRAVTQVEDLVNWITVMDLRNPSPAIHIDFDIRRDGDARDAPAPQEVTPGTRLTYRVHNRDVVPLYVYVLDLSSDGSISLLYPPVGGAQEELPNGKTLEKTIETFIPEGRDAVVDVYKVIATTRPIDPSLFPQGNIRGARPAPPAAVNQDPLAEFLSKRTRADSRGSFSVEVKSWVTDQASVVIRPASARFAGFAVHFEKAREAGELPPSFGSSRATCTGSAAADCFEPARAAQDGTVWELVQKSAVRGGGEATLSVGAAFDEAYKIQDQMPGAVRVEPLLETPVPGVVDQRGIDKRGLGSDSHHDEHARKDDQWHLKQTRALEAWKKIRDGRRISEGEETAGISIAHIDTGYREHPETWQEVGGRRGIDPSRGHDYYDDDDDALDPLLDDRPLDNPGHGTAAGSVIVSPTGCQLQGAQGCVNGVARGAQLVPLRVHRTVSQFNTRNLSRAIRDVAEDSRPEKLKLISIAMGGPPTLGMWRAVKAAEDKGVLIVSAAGNYVRTVVWPARFRSTIAVAATNVLCAPWKHSSRGSKVDISAPGESVWRATLDKSHEYINEMGKGTTFATGTTSGAAALWLAWHRDDPKLAALQQQGRVTEAFRAALQRSAWQPSGDASKDPPGSHCETDSWDKGSYGAGILNVTGLLEAPLELPSTRGLTEQELPDLPLFSSLYPDGTNPETIRSDYRSLFGDTRGFEPSDMNGFETELLHHYTDDEEVQRALDSLVEGQRGPELNTHVRDTLLKRDLSSRLRSALTQ